MPGLLTPSGEITHGTQANRMLDGPQSRSERFGKELHPSRKSNNDFITCPTPSVVINFVNRTIPPPREPLLGDTCHWLSLLLRCY